MIGVAPVESRSNIRQFKYFDKLVSAFVAILLVSNIVAPTPDPACVADWDSVS